MPTTKKGLVLVIKLLLHSFERHQNFYKPETKVLSKTIIYNTLSERDVSTYIKKKTENKIYLTAKIKMISRLLNLNNIPSRD